MNGTFQNRWIRVALSGLNGCVLGCNVAGLLTATSTFQSTFQYGNYKTLVSSCSNFFKHLFVSTKCDVIRLVNDLLLKERGAGKDEKHFPSRISLQLTPTNQTKIISVSVCRSSENPAREIGVERSIEGSFEPPAPHIGIFVSAGESYTTNLKPWKFEQSVYGNSGAFNWFLHYSINGREVFSSKPSKVAMLHPKSWFKNRYSSAYRPFTRQGGVIFAGDEYGVSVLWKLGKSAIGETMEWEAKGWIWLTYWPQ
ncbi:uncharacterized protein [Rutidosis leptorrhynchoides]|uniref:uncharacterized protein n=1 Tax=Rutidosis leptorrhynchoides TaxID=125765 RepID=UPI003A99CEC9